MMIRCGSRIVSSHAFSSHQETPYRGVMRKLTILMFALMICLPAGAQSTAKAKPGAKKAASAATVPVTSNNKQALSLYEEGAVLRENLRNTEAQEKFRAAVKADKSFASAYALLALLTHDPQEEITVRGKAKTLSAGKPKGEQLFIKWITSQKENDYVTAIAAMNDLLAKYPEDKRLRFMTGQWLVVQQRYDVAIRVLEEALAIDKDYAAALNEVGYAYSSNGDQEKGIEAMKRYVSLLPKEPNPRDSLAELNRLAGHYDEALKQYHEALKILPSFTSSQLGLADTYALMGQQDKARVEYAKAVAQETSKRDAMDYRFQSALTYVRERKFKDADKAFEQQAHEAHLGGFSDAEAEAYRAMALYQKDPNKALAIISKGEEGLKQEHAASQTVRDEELAQLVRLKAERAAEAGKKDVAEAAVKQLSTMALSSRSEVIQRSYHAAIAVQLFHQGKYAEAASEWQEDPDNTLTLKMLAVAQEKSGNAAEAAATRKRIMQSHKVLPEDAVAKQDMK